MSKAASPVSTALISPLGLWRLNGALRLAVVAGLMAWGAGAQKFAAAATGTEAAPGTGKETGTAGEARVTGFKFELTLGRSGTGPGEFHRPLALARTATGGLLVADTGNSRVQSLDGDGRFLWEAGGVGTAEGTLRRPIGVGPTGLEFLVLDAAGKRIHLFHARGEYLGVALDFARDDLVAELGMVEPRALTVDRSGNVLVTEAEGDRLLVFSPAWDLLGVSGGFGGGARNLEEPEGVAAAGDRIFVADSGNGRVQVLDLQGRFLSTWTLPKGSLPIGLAVDGRGNVFVADAQEDRILALGPGGTVTATFGARGGGAGSFRGPAAMCVLGDRLLVADAENDRLVQLVIEYAKPGS